MIPELEYLRGREAIRFARWNLLKREREFDQCLANEPAFFTTKIAIAERRLAEARARLSEVDPRHGAVSRTT